MAQTYINWECIIINDGSDDNTEDIALDYLNKDKRFNYKFQINKGLSAARNLGISIAKGEFIQLLDADDLIEKNKLSKGVELYKNFKNNDRIIIYLGMRYFENSAPKMLKILGRNHFIGHVELKFEDGLTSQKELIKFRNPFVISAPLYPAALFENIGLFDNDLTALEDWDLHLRCIQSDYLFHYHYEADTRTLIRLHDNSMMRSQHLLDANFGLVMAKHHLHRENPIETSVPFAIRFIKKIKNRLKL